MAPKWFVQGGGKVYGPLDAAKLQQLAKDGKIGPQTAVGQTQEGPWYPADQVLGGFAAPKTDAAAAPTATSSRQGRRWYGRWWAVFLLYPFLAFMGCGLVIQLIVPKETLDRWAAEAEERNRSPTSNREPTKAASKDIHPGFAAGFMTGAVSARGGLKKPTAAEINAAARRAATEANVPEQDRRYWTYQFELGFPMGWKKGQ